MLKLVLFRLLQRIPLIAEGLRRIRYRARLAKGDPAGEIRYDMVEGTAPHGWDVSLCSSLDLEKTSRWAAAQTLENITLTNQAGPDTGWFLAPGPELPSVPSAWLESALMVALTEDIDALAMAERVVNVTAEPPRSAEALVEIPWRSLTLFSAEGYRWDPETDTIQPRKTTLTAKAIGTAGIGSAPPRTSAHSPLRRGSYLGSTTLPATMRIGLRARLPAPPACDHHDPRPKILVTAPFLARGGAEHTLFETLSVLQDDLRIAFATLAPHREELDDRRGDFERLSPQLFSLGDWVHPDAMIPILLHLIDRLDIDILYNANGTTLFYDFAPRLRAARPNLRIIDHLYDHRVGYIERYQDPGLLASIDTCIAENHPIADVLTDDHGWPTERVPVVWSCGRPPEDLPPESSRNSIRRTLRQKLGFSESDVIFLTAARMHDQKRPLDLVQLAEAVQENPNIHFLVVGGGPMEAIVDQAISKSSNVNIRRLPFRTDVPDLILAADVGLLVSEFEGLPVFLLECLQLGRPFLGTEVGDLGRVIRETDSGMVVDKPGDIDMLAAAVRSLADAAIRQKFAINALLGGQRFSPDHCAREYWRVFLGDRRVAP